jgi:hypothetical protein
MTATVGNGGCVGNGVGVGDIGVAVAAGVAAARPHAESSSIVSSSVTQRNFGMGRMMNASYRVIRNDRDSAIAVILPI